MGYAESARKKKYDIHVHIHKKEHQMLVNESGMNISMSKCL